MVENVSGHSCGKTFCRPSVCDNPIPIPVEHPLLDQAGKIFCSSKSFRRPACSAYLCRSEFCSPGRILPDWLLLDYSIQLCNRECVLASCFHTAPQDLLADHPHESLPACNRACGKNHAPVQWPRWWSCCPCQRNASDDPNTRPPS